METKRTICACMLLIFLLSVSVQAATSVGGKGAPVATPPPQLAPKECGDKCKVRCENVQAHPDRCLKYCNDCCMVCKCVPSGHYGNRDECPCYRDRKNSKGKSKCP